jgi:hypothetical protein
MSNQEILSMDERIAVHERLVINQYIAMTNHNPYICSYEEASNFFRGLASKIIKQDRQKQIEVSNCANV